MATSDQYKARAIREAGAEDVNTVFELAFAYGTESGTFPFTLGGATTTITYPASSADMKSALEALSTVGVGGVKVKGAIGGPYQIEMIGGNAGQDVAPPIVDGSDLVPVQTPQVAVLQQGDETDYQELANSVWDDQCGVTNTVLRFLYTKLALVRARLGILSNTMYQTRTGQINQVDVIDKRFQNLQAIEAQTLKDIEDQLLTGTNGQRPSSGGVLTKMTPNGLPYGVLGRTGYCGRVR